MNKFKNYHTITALLAFVVMIVVSLLVSPSIQPARCSDDDPQCAVLKKRITTPRNDKEKNNRGYYCEQMKDRKCSEYENLCGDKSGGASFTAPDLAGTWTCKKNCPAGGVEKDASITQTGHTLTFENEGGGTSEGMFKTKDKVEATGWKLTADIKDNGKKLEWSNGTVWEKSKAK